MGILDTYTINNKTYKDFQSFISKQLRDEAPAMFENDTWDKIWNTMSIVHCDETHLIELEAIRDNLEDALQSLQELVKTVSLFYDRAIKKIDWALLGEYRDSIIKRLEPILVEELDDLRNLHSKYSESEHGKMSVDHIYIAFVTCPLEEISYPDPVVRDEDTGLMTREYLEGIAKTITSAITKLRKVVPSELPGTLLIWRLFDLEIPQEYRYFRVIYDLLKEFNYIPQETLASHEHPQDIYYRERYIKAALRRKPGLQ